MSCSHRTIRRHGNPGSNLTGWVWPKGQRLEIGGDPFSESASEENGPLPKTVDIKLASSEAGLPKGGHIRFLKSGSNRSAS